MLVNIYTLEGTVHWIADRHEKPKTARETRCAVQLFARPLAVSYSFSYLRKRISQSSWIDYNLPGLQFHALYTIGLQSSKWAKGHVSLLPGLVLLVVLIILIIIIVYCRLFFGKPCISKEIKLSEVDSEVHSLRSVEIYLNTSHRKYCGSTSQNHSGVVIIGAKVY